MNIWEYPIVKASDLIIGSILGNGEVVESIATGGNRYGDLIHFTFRSGKAGHCGKDNRLHVQSVYGRD